MRKALLTLLFVVLPTAALSHGADVRIVTIREASLKSGSDITGTVPEGSILTVGAARGGWFFVIYSGREGTINGWIDPAHVIPFVQALDFFHQKLQRDPSARAYSIRGMIRHTMGEHEAAIDDFNEAIRIDPKYAPAFYDRGLAWASKSEYDKVIADANEAIRLDPKYASAYHFRGWAKNQKQDYDEAIADFDEAIRLGRRDAETYNMRGNAWWCKGEYDRALADYNEAIRLSPNWLTPYTGRGNSRLGKGEYDKAIAHYDEAIQIDPKSAQPYYNRAVAKVLMRDPSAISAFQEVIEVERGMGNSSAYALILGRLSARLFNDDEQGRKLLENSQSVSKSAWLDDCLTFARGDLDESNLLKLATDTDKQTEAHCYLGLDALARGRNDAARIHFEWVRDHGTKNYTEYAIALAELKRLAEPAAESTR